MPIFFSASLRPNLTKRLLNLWTSSRISRWRRVKKRWKLQPVLIPIVLHLLDNRHRRRLTFCRTAKCGSSAPGPSVRSLAGFDPLSCPVLLTVHVLILPLAFSQQKSLRDVLPAWDKIQKNSIFPQEKVPNSQRQLFCIHNSSNGWLSV